MYSKRIGIGLLAAAVAAVVIAACDDDPPVGGGSTSLIIHEWGVLLGSTSSNSLRMTSRPEPYALMAREPVIYIHTKGISSLDVRVTFMNGVPSAIYPEAEVAERVISWNGVKILEGDMVTHPADTQSVPDDGLTPWPIVHEYLNNVEADQLAINGDTARFLFYEGNLSLALPVAITLPADTLQAMVENTAAYTVYDLTVVRFLEQDSHFVCPSALGHFDSLGAGEARTLDLVSPWVTHAIAAPLLEQGFTYKEAAAFAYLWGGALYGQRDGLDMAHVMYRLPQSVYDGLFPLYVSVTPDEVLRSLYVLIHVEGE